jgi:hypothetical protein
VQAAAEQATAPAIGGQIVRQISVTDAPNSESAFDDYADITLPPGFSVSKTYAGHGSGCVAASPGLVCSLETPAVPRG